MDKLDRWMQRYGKQLSDEAKLELVEICGNAEARAAKHVLAAQPDLLTACEVFLESRNVGADAFEPDKLKVAYRLALAAVREARGES